MLWLSMAVRVIWSLILASTALAQGHLTLRYGAHEGSLLDFDTPAGSGPFLTVLAVHGGGWSAGSRADAAPFCRLVLEAGMACAAVDYRLAPAARFPAQIDDLREALVFLRSNAARYRINARGVVLAGESAGGHLVSWLGLAPSSRGGMPILGVIAFAPPLDLVALGEPGRRLGVVPPEVRDLLGVGEWGEEEVNRMRQASPVSLVHAGAPPFLIVHGDADHLVPYPPSGDFCDRLRAEGTRCELVQVPRAKHGLWNEDQFDRWKSVWRTTLLRWIDTEIRR